MDLLLWRHAEAKEGSPDHIRELTPKGFKQAEKVANFLRQHLPADSRILVSPTVRTRQTVSALTDQFSLVPTIAPGAAAAEVLSAAGWPDSAGTVLVVGHQPTLGSVAAQLLECDSYSLSVKKGALWWFSHRESDGAARATLRLVISPDFL
ncbi:MAG: phosphohistidine phosphatase SixA [Gallionella sp.]